MNLVLESIDLPVQLRTQRKLTDEELIEFFAANELTRVEREPNGELIVTSLPGTADAAIETNVLMELRLWAREDGRGRVLGWNAGVTLPDGSVRAADAAWMSLDQWHSVSAEQRQGYARLCPEFVIEVRSNIEGLEDLQARMKMWISNGAELGSLIDPQRRVVEVYRRGEAVEVHEDPTARG